MDEYWSTGSLFSSVMWCVNIFSVRGTDTEMREEFLFGPEGYLIGPFALAKIAVEKCPTAPFIYYPAYTPLMSSVQRSH